MQPELIDLVGNADQLGVVLVITVVVRVGPVLVLSHQVVASVQRYVSCVYIASQPQSIVK